MPILMLGLDVAGVAGLVKGFGSGLARGMAESFSRRGSLSTGFNAITDGIPESSRVLPPSDAQAWTWTRRTKLAGVDPLTGEMRANPSAWAKLTPGQRSTVFWEEWSHRSRIVGQPMWKRKVNAYLYHNTSLGKFLEESIARSHAMDSIPAGLRYGWSYKRHQADGVNRLAVILEGGGLIAIPGATGYFGAEAILGD